MIQNKMITEISTRSCNSCNGRRITSSKLRKRNGATSLQLTIPYDIASHLNWKGGEMLHLTSDGETLIVRKLS